ncbi:M48 family metalloprotease [Bacillus taeanensis]|uniref:M48 family peptidase n=1 Tax=Bacillus taeanensis TaxID=273032 RepID=A0A366XX95_9BACI|nr:M48 family metalloprotease [Bacillus taeanensis]RBW68763.1 hypothetical protein DS031_14550 [Bacillus taeanensis]
MKKFYVIFTIFYLLYAGAIAVYLLQLEPGYVPEMYKGTASDPAQFMTAGEIKEAYHLQLIEYFTYFLSTPLDLLILILIMAFSVKIRNKAINIAKKSRWQLAYYYTVLTIAMTLLYLPLDLFFYHLNLRYELSSQSFLSWSIDFAIGFALELVLGFLFLLFLYWLIAKQPKKWWLTMAFLSLSFNILILFLAPVVFMPLFNDYQPIQNQELKAEIQELAKESGIPNAKILEMNMSKQSNGINAFVTGIGSNKMIVLGDTAIENMTTEEIKFVIAHEIGHYKLNHIYNSLILAFILSFLFGYGTYKIYHVPLKNSGIIGAWKNKLILQRCRCFSCRSSSLQCLFHRL